MKVLHVIPSIARSYGGPVYSLLGFLEAAQTAGIDGEVAAPAATPSDAAYVRSVVRDAPLNEFRTHGRGAFIVSPTMQRWLQSELHRFDVIHIYGLLNGVSSLAARLCRHRRVPYILHPFGTLSRYTYRHRRRQIKRAYYRLLDKPNVSAASGLHFTTTTEEQEARWHGIEWSRRAHVIPPPWLRDDLNAVYEPRRKGTGANVLLLARLNPVKRVELLLGAWPRVLARLPHARLTIGGTGEAEYERYLRSIVERTGISDSVAFAGFVTGEAKRKLFLQADLFVLPSYHENFGVVVIEALAAGLPVVVTPEVQLSAFVQEHHFGLVAPGEEVSLSEAIVNALGDDALRSDTARRAPGTVASTFSVEVTGERLRRMYRHAKAHPVGSQRA